MRLVAIVFSVIAVLAIGGYWYETGLMSHPCRSSDLLFGPYTKVVGNIAFWGAVLLWAGVSQKSDSNSSEKPEKYH